ncbi:MAG: dicarboxylate/amino acid:cation symporter [Polyangiaceae bacterium]|nr:dicarboxylate/amino acid:cation symporter [Polyangiaceae bacterium]
MRLLRAHGFSLLLILSIAGGMVLGQTSPATAKALRPLGDLFLNLIFMLVVPLTFFTVSSAIASTRSTKKLGRISGSMLGVFLFTSLAAAAGALVFMLVVEPAPGAGLELRAPELATPPSLAEQLVRAVSVSDFPELISRKSMLPLILFAVAVGLATLQQKDKAADFGRMLSGGAAVFMRLVDYVLYLAPVGLFAWFGATFVDTGAELATSYLAIFVAYYAFAGLYFVFGFSAYAYAAGRTRGLARFWAHMLKPSLTALGTCSSMATMPVNLEAAPKMGVPEDVCEVVIPVGAALHKDGSVIGGVAKILFALSLFGQPLGAGELVATVGVAVLVGVVMGAIPSGGMLGELLILSVFGFPPETLPLLAAISILIDPVATLLNATGDNVAAMMVTRLVDGDVWRTPPAAPQPTAEPAGGDKG